MTKAAGKKLIEQYQGLIKVNKNIRLHESLHSKEQKSFKVYKYRMISNIRFQLEDFIQNPDSLLSSIMSNGEITIENINMNDGLTVVEIYWDFL